MERWIKVSNGQRPRKEVRPEVDAFLDEIEAVCRKHVMSISHEDMHGAFIIEDFDDDDMKWLRNACDERERLKHQ